MVEGAYPLILSLFTLCFIIYNSIANFLSQPLPLSDINQPFKHWLAQKFIDFKTIDATLKHTHLRQAQSDNYHLIHLQWINNEDKIISFILSFDCRPNTNETKPKPLTELPEFNSSRSNPQRCSCQHACYEKNKL